MVLIAGRGDATVIPEVDSRHPRTESVGRMLATGSGAAEFEALRRDLLAHLRPLLSGVEVILAHNVMTMPFNLALSWALLDTGVPLVAWTHDIAWLDDRYRAFRRPDFPCSILNHPQPGVVHAAISEDAAERLASVMGLPRAEISVVPNGVGVLDFLDIDQPTRDLAAEAGLLGADPLVLLPVRITPRKRLGLALEAADQLRRAHPNLRMVVSGPLGAHSGDNHDHFEHLLERRAALALEGHVKFLTEFSRAGEHPVSGPMVPGFFRLADVILLTSESEGFGLPVLEAAISRTPIVTPDLPVLREAGGDDMVTFPPDATGALIADAVQAALDRPGSRLRSRVRREYDWPVVLDRTLAVISRATGG